MKREPKRHTSRRERERERKRQNKKKGVVRSKQKAREIERESCSSHPLSDADGRRAREGRNKRCLHSLLFVVLERDQEGEEEEHTQKKRREWGQRPTRNGLHGDEREKAKPLAPKEKRKKCSPRILTRKESSPTGGGGGGLHQVMDTSQDKLEFTKVKQHFLLLHGGRPHQL